MTGLERTAGAESGEVEAGQQEKGGLALTRPTRDRVTTPSLREVKKCLHITVRHRVGLLAHPLQGQELDTMVLMCPWQLSRLTGSVKYGKRGLLLTEEPSDPRKVTKCAGQEIKTWR